MTISFDEVIRRTPIFNITLLLFIVALLLGCKKEELTKFEICQDVYGKYIGIDYCINTLGEEFELNLGFDYDSDMYTVSVCDTCTPFAYFNANTDCTELNYTFINIGVENYVEILMSGNSFTGTATTINRSCTFSAEKQ